MKVKAFICRHAPFLFQLTLGTLNMHVIYSNDSNRKAVQEWSMPVFSGDEADHGKLDHVIHVFEGVVMAQVGLTPFVLFNAPDLLCFAPSLALV